MKAHFFELFDALCRGLSSGETLLCDFSGERSDFIRFNHARVRQAGSVDQRYVSIRLVRDHKHASATLSLSNAADDPARAAITLKELRDVLTQVPADPWLLIAEEPQSTEDERRG